MQEEWRGISGFQNYEISNLGRVRNRYLLPCSQAVIEL